MVSLQRGGSAPTGLVVLPWGVEGGGAQHDIAIWLNGRPPPIPKPKGNRSANGALVGYQLPKMPQGGPTRLKAHPPIAGSATWRRKKTSRSAPRPHKTYTHYKQPSRHTCTISRHLGPSVPSVHLPGCLYDDPHGQGAHEAVCSSEHVLAHNHHVATKPCSPLRCYKHMTCTSRHAHIEALGGPWKDRYQQWALTIATVSLR